MLDEEIKRGNQEEKARGGASSAGCWSGGYEQRVVSGSHLERRKSRENKSVSGLMQSDSVYQKYRDEVIILLGTGLRISELCGLTETDLDFENRIINVDHQLLRSAETGYYIEKPKTQSGIRQIPMSEKVYEALGRVLENRKGTKQIAIDGYSNFLFLNRDGCPKTNVNYARVCFKTVKVTRQGYWQGRQQPGNKELSSHIWWQSGGSF